MRPRRALAVTLVLAAPRRHFHLAAPRRTATAPSCRAADEAHWTIPLPGLRHRGREPDALVQRAEERGRVGEQPLRVPPGGGRVRLPVQRGRHLLQRLRRGQGEDRQCHRGQRRSDAPGRDVRLVPGVRRWRGAARRPTARRSSASAPRRRTRRSAAGQRYPGSARGRSAGTSRSTAEPAIHGRREPRVALERTREMALVRRSLSRPRPARERSVGRGPRPPRAQASRRTYSPTLTPERPRKLRARWPGWTPAAAASSVSVVWRQPSSPCAAPGRRSSHAHRAGWSSGGSRSTPATSPGRALPPPATRRRRRRGAPCEPPRGAEGRGRADVAQPARDFNPTAAERRENDHARSAPAEPCLVRRAARDGEDAAGRQLARSAGERLRSEPRGRPRRSPAEARRAGSSAPGSGAR